MPFGDSKNNNLEVLKVYLDRQNETIAKNTETMTRITQQSAQLSMQMTTIINQHEQFVQDSNKRWDSLPVNYVPRQELAAQGLDNRVQILEEFRVAATKDIADLKLNIQQQLQIALKQIDEQVNTNRKDIDGRTLSVYIAALFLLINVVWSIAQHFLFK